MLALHAGAIDFDTLPFVTVSRLMRAVPLPVPSSCITRTRSASSRSRISATSRCRRISARPRPTNTHALYRQAVSFIALLQQRGEELRSDEYPPYKVAFDTDKLSWELEFFYKYLPAAVSRRVAVGRSAAGALARSGRRSSRSWPASRACCAIATITAAT